MNFKFTAEAVLRHYTDQFNWNLYNEFQVYCGSGIETDFSLSHDVCFLVEFQVYCGSGIETY